MILRQCFVERGADLTAVESPFAIATRNSFAASIANIRWEVGGATAADVLPCPPRITPPS